MSYVLVSLVGDEATEMTDEFVRWFEVGFPPVAVFRGAKPDHRAVSEAMGSTPVALVFGHDGGGSLRASSVGEPWASPDEFASMFGGARVWAYACDTRASNLADDLDSFGRHAHASGVSVFAGHCHPITGVPTFISMPQVRSEVYRGLARAFRAFVQGENRADALRLVALKTRGPNTVFSAPLIKDVMKCLRVLA